MSNLTAELFRNSNEATGNVVKMQLFRFRIRNPVPSTVTTESALARVGLILIKVGLETTRIEGLWLETSYDPLDV